VEASITRQRPRLKVLSKGQSGLEALTSLFISERVLL